MEEEIREVEIFVHDQRAYFHDSTWKKWQQARRFLAHKEVFEKKNFWKIFWTIIIHRELKKNLINEKCAKLVHFIQWFILRIIGLSIRKKIERNNDE